MAVTLGLAHGAWCWDRLLGPPRALGHGAVAVDLPCDDADAAPLRAAPEARARLSAAPEALARL